LCPEFQLDAGYAVTSYVPDWMLSATAPDDPAILLPDLPQVVGHVLTADAIGHETELLRYFSQLPQLPGRSSRRETAPFCSLAVNLLLRLPGEPPIVADMFAGSRPAAAALLDGLADTDAPGGSLYDNLDQGWALRILVQHDAVLVLDWSGEADERREDARALRLSRHAVAAQAIAARRRLDHLHSVLMDVLGRDLWPTRPEIDGLQRVEAVGKRDGDPGAD
jgi:hypothetical protein